MGNCVNENNLGMGNCGNEINLGMENYMKENKIQHVKY
jgi:hypothetical protein